ncbi:hypothetical protein NHX12_032334 [Muraenolepis orangiensis]|uniref:Uncharacterized protein n=1 Tax=Muraenolepis orangiensis TaxID=630683 RepID=A0A9Q0E7B2_9TELE|nr:hypothetical protein NHX12_032334 [Muraenolepis orangiensis]
MEWGAWNPCSVSCGNVQGLRTRMRVCSHDTSGCEHTCVGPTNQVGQCAEAQPCPVNGGWGPWGAYSPCSVTCGVGHRRSVRTCDRPAPKYKGNECPTQGSIQTLICTNSTHCPIDGVWGPWSDWGLCAETESCTEIVGRQKRRRECLHTDFGGAPCPTGALTEFRECLNITGCTKYHTRPILEYHTRPILEYHTRPILEYHTRPILEYHTRPILEYHTRPILEYHTRPILEYHTRPILEYHTRPILEYHTRPILEYHTRPILEYHTRPILEYHARPI